MPPRNRAALQGAAIDVGSNAIRLAIASGRSIRSIREPLRLGEEAFTSGVLSEATLARLATVFRRFAKELKSAGVRTVRAVATSALREAKNGAEAVERIRRASGIQVRIIPPEEEARLVHEAISRVADIRRGAALEIDIGGGSVQLARVRDGRIDSIRSLPLGAVRLVCSGAERARAEINRFAPEIRAWIGGKPGKVFGIGGSIRELGRLRRRLLKKGRTDRIKTRELPSLIDRLEALGVEGRIRELALPRDRADIIVAVARVLSMLLESAGASRVRIPGVSLREGLLFDPLHVSSSS